MVREWENWLMGKKLQYKRPRMIGRPAGGEANPDYHLCSDGTVMRKPGPAGRAAGQNMPVYSPGVNQSRGTWHVIVSKGIPYLMVRDGRDQRLKLEAEGDNFLLNGKRYIVTANELCR
jgi:hypothetical protein